MTRHKADAPEPLRIAGRPAAAALRALAPELSRRVLARLLTELPVYAALPGEEVAGDIAAIVQHSVRLFADAIEARRIPDDTELTEQRRSARRRAEEGVPLDAILAAYQLGIAMVWSEVSAGARPEDHTDLRAVLELLLGLQRRILCAVSESYLAARRVIDSEEHNGRHALMAALLSGAEPDGTAAVAPRYAVLTLALGRHPDERADGGGGAADRGIAGGGVGSGGGGVGSGVAGTDSAGCGGAGGESVGRGVAGGGGASRAIADAESAGRGAAGGGDAGRGFAGGDKGSRAAGGRAAANGAATSSGGVVSGRIVAARRKVRRVREVLDTFADQPCLTAFQSDRGTALIPLDDAAAPDHGRLRALVADAAAAAGVEVTAAVVLAEPADVPAAAARTAEILDLVRATGRPPGLYRLADVLLDYQLSRPSPALAALAARLDALAPKPELLATLETYLKLGRDRRAVAAALHVHPNTIDYRLRRISVLTGLSPNRAEDLGELHASLVARQVLGDGL